MIVKGKESKAPTDRFGRAGFEAEKQMAFYLRRAFADAADILVFNDLRLERHGEVAQIDHLVLHRFGFVVIESKSVTGEIAVNEHGEFTRIYGRRAEGMQSPIHQARLQADLLGRLLNDHREKLRRKLLFGLRQGEFGEFRFKVLVAVSDRGIIKRLGGHPPELYKADRIVDEINKIIGRHDKTLGLSGFVNFMMADRKTAAQLETDNVIPFTSDEMQEIQQFLLNRNVPTTAGTGVYPSEIDREISGQPAARRHAAPKAPFRPRTSTSAFALNACKHCQGSDVLATSGRYGYYFKCNICGGNTPIDFSCPECGRKARIKKSGRNFSRVCDSCGANSPFFENPE